MAYKGHQRNRQLADSRQQLDTARAHALSQTAQPVIAYAWAQEYWLRNKGGNGQRLLVEAKHQVAIAPELSIKGRSGSGLAQLVLSMDESTAPVAITTLDQPYKLNGHTVTLSKDQEGNYLLQFNQSKKSDS